MPSDGLQAVLASAFCCGVIGAVVTYGPLAILEDAADLFADIWDGMKDGLYLIFGKRHRRTAVQKRFNTDMKWHQVRWSIARLEHELMPKDEWTHDVRDCVDPDCNPEFLALAHLEELFPNPSRIEKH